MPFILGEKLWFPDPSYATKEGLLAIGGDLSVERLILAYSMGIFPWYSEGQPILWWCPDPRFVLYPDSFHTPKSLKKILKKDLFTVTFDKCFDKVIHACASTRKIKGEDTWLTNEMIDAYIRLHKLGYAHSVEVWLDNSLVGGLYGVCLGCVYFGESMFYKVDNASKVGLVFLVHALKKWGIELIDCQVYTDNLNRFGAEFIPLSKFMQLLSILTKKKSLAPSPSWFIGELKYVDIILEKGRGKLS